MDCALALTDRRLNAVTVLGMRVHPDAGQHVCQAAARPGRKLYGALFRLLDLVAFAEQRDAFLPLCLLTECVLDAPPARPQTQA